MGKRARSWLKTNLVLEKPFLGPCELAVQHGSLALGKSLLRMQSAEEPKARATVKGTPTIWTVPTGNTNMDPPPPKEKRRFPTKGALGGVHQNLQKSTSVMVATCSLLLPSQRASCPIKECWRTCLKLKRVCQKRTMRHVLVSLAHES